MDASDCTDQPVYPCIGEFSDGGSACLVYDPAWGVINYPISSSYGASSGCVEFPDSCDEPGSPQCDPRTEDCEEECDSNTEDCGDCGDNRGNPVDLVTGDNTVFPSRDDARVPATTGELRVNRVYSSWRAIRDYMVQYSETVATSDAAKYGKYLPHNGQSFSAGWYHTYDYWLVERESAPGVLTEVVLLKPSRRAERWFSFNSWSQETGARHLTSPVGGLTVTSRDGEELIFESLPWITAPERLRVHRLTQVTTIDGVVEKIRFYDPAESAPCFAASGSTREGKLCQIARADGSAQVNVTAFDAASGFIRQIEFGPASDPDYSRLDYNYSGAVTVLDSAGASTGMSTYQLDSVDHSVSVGASYSIFDSESYSYTSDGYYRPDLAGVTEFFQDSSEKILSADGHTMLLMTVARAHDGEFLGGHHYDGYGRAVTSEIAGEFLRIEYVEMFTDLSGAAPMTLVTNESTGSVAEYSIGTDGRVASVTDSCTSCGGSANSIERDAYQRVIARRTAAPGTQVPNGATGVRTTYERDAMGRITLEQRNWESAASTLVSDPVASVVSASRFSYAANGLKSEESRVFSAPCLGGVDPHASLSCPIATSEEPRSIVDYDSGVDAYDSSYNAAPDDLPTQKITRGITLTNVGTGSLDWVSRTRAYHYDSDGRLIEMESAAGVNTVYEYYVTSGNNYGRLWKTTVEGVLVEERGNYDAMGNPGWSVASETGLTTTYIRDSSGDVVETRVNDGTSTRTTFTERDSQGRIIRTRRTGDGLGYEIIEERAIYNGGAGAPAPTSASFCDTQSAVDVGAAQTECLDGLGQLAKIDETDSGTGTTTLVSTDSVARMTFTRDGQIELSRFLDGASNLERQNGFGYNERGRRVRSEKYTSSDTVVSSDSTMLYNDLGWITRSESFIGVATDTYYDRLGRISSVVSASSTPDEATTEYGYDAHGNLRTVRDALGNTTTYIYDDFGQLILVDSPDSGVTRYAYSADGQLVSKRTEDGAVSTLSYDSRGRLDSELFDVTSGPHLVDRYFRYDNFASSPGTVGATCVASGQVFDPSNVNGRLAWVQHGAGITYYGYDSFGAVNAVFEQAEPTFDVCTLRVTRYGFDPVGRLVSIVYPSGRTLGYVYDSTSSHPQRITMAEPGAVSVDLLTGLSFDGAGELVSYTVGSVSFAATFDLAGQFIDRDYVAASGHRFHWSIDADQSTSVDADERDADGNPLQLGDVSRAKVITAAYDAQSRLTSSVGTNLRGYQDCVWEYDAVGNRVGETCYGTQVSYEIEPGGNELLATSYSTNAAACNDPDATITQTRTRDVLGRQTNGFDGRFGDAVEDFTLTYGPDTRLERATVGGATYDYVYDHRMLRWRTTAGGTASGSRDTVYGTSGSLLSETKYSGDVHEYVWLGSTPVALLVDADGPSAGTATAMALGVDHLGTPYRAWNSATGVTAWAGDYEAFGSCTPWVPGGGSPAVNVSLRFPGQLEDAETGMHYNWHRYYEGDLGRYQSEDPLRNSGPLFAAQVFSGGMPIKNDRAGPMWNGAFTDYIYQEGGVSSFAYGGNEPFAYVDPSGLILWCTRSLYDIFCGADPDTFDCFDCPNGALSCKRAGRFRIPNAPCYLNCYFNQRPFPPGRRVYPPDFGTNGRGI
ncbi:MAG: RHS repeat-associated core domain-containing protein [Myxococcota bacterium]